MQYLSVGLLLLWLSASKPIFNQKSKSDSKLANMANFIFKSLYLSRYRPKCQYRGKIKLYTSFTLFYHISSKLYSQFWRKSTFFSTSKPLTYLMACDRAYFKIIKFAIMIKVVWVIKPQVPFDRPETKFSYANFF